MRPISIETSATCGRGNAMRPSPRIVSSNPPPKDTATTATPSTSAKLVKPSPAANQKRSRRIGNVSRTATSACIGSDGAEAEASSAWIITKSPNVLRLDGKIRSRLMPKPPPMPVTKKAGGPPIGPVTAPKAKKAVKRVPSVTPVP